MQIAWGQSAESPALATQSETHVSRLSLRSLLCPTSPTIAIMDMAVITPTMSTTIVNTIFISMMLTIIIDYTTIIMTITITITTTLPALIAMNAVNLWVLFLACFWSLRHGVALPGVTEFRGCALQFRTLNLKPPLNGGNIYATTSTWYP